jgi:hypothetical protein
MNKFVVAVILIFGSLFALIYTNIQQSFFGVAVLVMTFIAAVVFLIVGVIYFVSWWQKIKPA